MITAITLDQLINLVPEFSTSHLDKQHIANTMNEVFIGATGVNTVNRRAAFIAQTAVESAYYSALIENLHYSAAKLLVTFPTHFDATNVMQYANQPDKIANRAYANRMGNGDESSGDGFKYKGRGLIQLTGKDNYQHCSDDLKIDFVTDPDYAATITGAFLSTNWFWNKNNLNSWADKDDIKTITHLVNGGYNGLADRTMIYQRAKHILT